MQTPGFEVCAIVYGAVAGAGAGVLLLRLLYRTEGLVFRLDNKTTRGWVISNRERSLQAEYNYAIRLGSNRP